MIVCSTCAHENDVQLDRCECCGTVLPAQPQEEGPGKTSPPQGGAAEASGATATTSPPPAPAPETNVAGITAPAGNGAAPISGNGVPNAQTMESQQPKGPPPRTQALGSTGTIAENHTPNPLQRQPAQLVPSAPPLQGPPRLLPTAGSPPPPQPFNNPHAAPPAGQPFPGAPSFPQAPQATRPMQPVRAQQVGVATIQEASGIPVPTVASPPSRFVSQTPSYAALPALNATFAAASPTGSSAALMAPFPTLGQRVDAYSLAQSPLGQRVATPAANDPLIGNQIGNYLIQKRIGKGGFGAVYLAKHIFIQQNVAIKVLHVDRQTEPEIIERFKREAHTLAQLTHKHIVQLSDFGMIPNQGFYLAMEYLEGRNLGTILRKKYRFSLSQIKFMFEQLCDVLQYVHAMGIVHRDLKPGNVFLLKNSPEEAPQIRLIDFGIATLNQELGSLTGTGTYLGTAKYISPEQGRGDRQLDGRADLYSAAVMLYRLLTGHLPFDGEQPITVLYNQIHAPPPALKALAPDQEWHPQLEAFMQKAMAKLPEDRPQSGHEFYRGLAEAIDAQLGVAPLAETTISRPGSPAAQRQPSPAPASAPAPAASGAPGTTNDVPANAAAGPAPVPSETSAAPSSPAPMSPTGTTTAPLAPSRPSGPPVFQPSSSSLPAVGPYEEGDQDLQRTIAGEPPPELMHPSQGTAYDFDGGDTMLSGKPPDIPSKPHDAAPPTPAPVVLAATSLLDETQSTMIGGAPPSLGAASSTPVVVELGSPSSRSGAAPQATQEDHAPQAEEAAQNPLAKTQEHLPGEGPSVPELLDAIAAKETQQSDPPSPTPASNKTDDAEDADDAPEMVLGEDDEEPGPPELLSDEDDDEFGGDTIQRPMRDTIASPHTGATPPPPPGQSRPPAPPVGVLPTGQFQPSESTGQPPSATAPPAPFPAVPGGQLAPAQGHKRRAGDFPLPPGSMSQLSEPQAVASAPQGQGEPPPSEEQNAQALQPSASIAAPDNAAQNDPLEWFDRFGEEHNLNDDEDDPFSGERSHGKMLMGAGVLFVLFALLWWSMSGPSSKPQPPQRPRPSPQTKRPAPAPRVQPVAPAKTSQPEPTPDASSGSTVPPPIPTPPGQPDQTTPPEPSTRTPDQASKTVSPPTRRRTTRRRRRYIRRRRVKKRTKRRKPPVDTRKPPPRDRDPYGINPFKQ